MVESNMAYPIGKKPKNMIISYSQKKNKNHQKKNAKEIQRAKEPPKYVHQKNLELLEGSQKYPFKHIPIASRSIDL